MKLKARELLSGTSWRAIYVDPDSERELYVTLEPHEARTAETRRAWAIDKARDVARRQMELEQGAVRATGEKLTEAIERYYADHPRLRPRTIKTYRNATDKLATWAAGARVVTVDDLTRARLIGFRKYLLAQPKRRSVKAGKRGQAAPTADLRGAVVVNQELRSVGTVLRYLHEVDTFARLTFDDLRRGLKAVKTGRNPPTFLSLVECGQLVRAALAHDADTFTETRAEHTGEGRRRIGTTPCYDPIAPFLVTVLLTGTRVGEALALRWSYVHLDLVDAKGQPIGELRLPSEVTKTAHGRRVRLDVSPTVRDLLGELQEQAGEDEFVFGATAELARDVVEAARKRLVASYGAPKQFTWQLLRSTCSTVSTNAASMWAEFGHSAVFASAKRAGHSVVTAEKRYADVLAVAPAARTLEAAMTIEAEIAEVLARARARQRPVEAKAAAPVHELPARRRLRAVGAR